MNNQKKYIAIDVGSVALSIVLLNSNKEILQTGYGFHESRITDKLLQMLSVFDLNDVCGIAATSSSASYVKTTSICDNRVAYIKAAKALHAEVGSVLIVGGEKFGLVQFDENRNYRKFKSNSSCAAGTGSFLDQQCTRLNLGSIEEFSALANNNKGDFPKIASRCSVFAKTDLIHAQQEGYSLSEICDGLCYGLAKNIVDTLFKSSTINFPVVFAGGVSLNGAVVKHIEQLIGEKVVVGENSNLYGAIGAGINLIEEATEEAGHGFKSLQDIVLEDKQERKFFHRALKLELSDYPDFTSVEKYNFKSEILKNAPHVEVYIYVELQKLEYNAFIGFDIGSTSTKAILIDNEKHVLAGFYTRTSGQPVTAMRIILEAIQNIIDKKKISLNILGTGARFLWSAI